MIDPAPGFTPIPSFPIFKCLELADRAAILTVTSKFEPYSDFDFGSMWSWDYSGSMQVSMLFGNLIVQFSDYVTGEPFLSFIGSNRIDDTILELLALSDARAWGNELRLVPKSVANSVNRDMFAVDEDRNQFDYISSLPKISTFDGREFDTHRRRCRQFLRAAGPVRVAVIDLGDVRVRHSISGLFELWQDLKGAEVDSSHERIAIRRCIDSAATLNLIAVGVYVREDLIAFNISGILPNEFCICHFEKADYMTYPGVYPFLKQQVATILTSLGLKYMNFEQDLGIPGLRTSKRSYAPISMLHKYRIRLRGAPSAP